MHKMKIYKFGGASVKDAQGVKNVATVLEKTGEKDLVVVVSAMGKMTNAFEGLINLYFSNPKEIKPYISEIYEYHKAILDILFSNENHPIFEKTRGWIKKLSSFLKTNKSTNHAFVYDQVVCFGELISTTIISEYLNNNGFKNTFLDVRSCIKTDATYRDAKVDWETTQSNIKKLVSSKGITITQGFLASEKVNNFTTTLGREGSDYTAGIFAYCLDADSVSIWKDVPGVLNADPRYFSKTTLLKHISYREAIELAFYGASVIHPKTLQPLQRKEIPLYVKSFLNPLDKGTCVGKGATLDPMTSCFILKRDQVLISLSSLDFSYMMEDNISEIFNLFHTFQMRVTLMQNSAISFSVCVENKYNTLDKLLSKLKRRFKVKVNEGVTIYTIRHATPKEIKALSETKDILLKQDTRETVQLVIKD